MKKMRLRMIKKAVLAVGIVLLCFAGCSRETDDSLRTLEPETDDRLQAGEEMDGEEQNREIPEKSDVPEEEQDETETIFVYVCGAVMHPGVYELSGEARVYEALAKAGGLREDAAENAVNQAQILADGQQILIPTKEEASQGIAVAQPSLEQPETDGKVNLNTASKEELMTLSGIGESRAESILAYREANGPFHSIEELMNVDGIKEGIFQKLKDSITI
jgi:competence protein ComEA